MHVYVLWRIEKQTTILPCNLCAILLSIELAPFLEDEDDVTLRLSVRPFVALVQCVLTVEWIELVFATDASQVVLYNDATI